MDILNAWPARFFSLRQLRALCAADELSAMNMAVAPFLCSCIFVSLYIYICKTDLCYGKQTGRCPCMQKSEPLSMCK